MTTSTIIIGGGSGMGRALAERLLADGERVIIAGRDAGKLDRTAEELRAAHPNADLGTRAVDVGAEEDVRALYRHVGDVDHVVTTAIDLANGYMELAEVDPVRVRKAWDTKLLGPILLAKHGAGRIRGSLTIVSGFNAYRPARGNVAIATANGAVESLVRALALELAPVRVNAVSPGWIDTDIWDAMAGADRRRRLDAMGERLPVRQVGRAEDVAAALHAVGRNAHVTGTVLHVDGGQRLV